MSKFFLFKYLFKAFVCLLGVILLGVFIAQQFFSYQVNDVRVYGYHKKLTDGFQGAIIELSQDHYIYNEKSLVWSNCSDLNYYFVKFLQGYGVISSEFYFDQNSRETIDIFLEQDGRYIKAFLFIDKNKLYYVFQGADFGGKPPTGYRGYQPSEDCSGLNNL